MATVIKYSLHLKIFFKQIFNLVKFNNKMSSSAEEEETGPSVDSADPEERIAARRLRIQRRLEAQKR